MLNLLRGILSKLLGRRMRTETGTATIDVMLGNERVTGGVSWTKTEQELDTEAPDDPAGT